MDDGPARRATDHCAFERLVDSATGNFPGSRLDGRVTAWPGRAEVGTGVDWQASKRRMEVVMSLSLVFLLVGAAFVAGGTVAYRGGTSLAVRSASAAALAMGSLALLIGLVNALSGTM